MQLSKILQSTEFWGHNVIVPAVSIVVETCICIYICTHTFLFSFFSSNIPFFYLSPYSISFSWYSSHSRQGNRPLPYVVYGKVGRDTCDVWKGWWGLGLGRKDDVLGKGTRPNVKNGTRKLNLNSWKKRRNENHIRYSRVLSFGRRAFLVAGVVAFWRPRRPCRQIFPLFHILSYFLLCSVLCHLSLILLHSLLRRTLSSGMWWRIVW
jgi:hypothetical protein